MIYTPAIAIPSEFKLYNLLVIPVMKNPISANPVSSPYSDIDLELYGKPSPYDQKPRRPFPPTQPSSSWMTIVAPHLEQIRYPSPDIPPT
jgi:hypothetical protein